MVGAGLVAVGALAAGVFLTTQSDTDSGLVQVNGRVESDQIVVSARVPARIADVLVREGDEVRVSCRGKDAEAALHAVVCLQAIAPGRRGQEQVAAFMKPHLGRLAIHR